MEQTKAEFYNTIPVVSIAPLLGVTEEDFSSMLDPQVVSTGFRDTMVPLKDKAVLSRLKVDLPGIAKLSQKYHVGGLHVFALLENDDRSITSARNFGPIDGIDEEAATGTSSGALLCYLKRYGQLTPRNLYCLEQGENMGRLSYIYGKFVNDTVWIGGTAALVRKSELEL
jgi:PhzF family phenazine biosynthesis protein